MKMLTVENTEDRSRVAYVFEMQDSYLVRFLADDLEVPEDTSFDSFHDAVGEAAYLVGDDVIDTGQLELTF